MESYTLFFYGTLMVPQILSRVLQQPQSQPQIQSHKLTPKPALLHGFQRRRAKWADYPGIIPSPTGTTGDGDSTSDSDSDSVVGTLVTGLTDADIQKLDVFEGIEYEKQTVTVRILREGSAIGDRREESVAKSEEGHVRDVLDAASTRTGTGTGTGAATTGEEVQALAYVYVAGEHQLEDGLWDFEDFKREKLGKWVGGRYPD